MKFRFRFLAALLALAFAGVAFAQPSLVEGEVRKVDAAQQKVTLKHGEIKGLDIPAMTMAYRVRDPSRLSQLTPGEKVRFAVEKIDGAYTVTAIQKAD